MSGDSVWFVVVGFWVLICFSAEIEGGKKILPFKNNVKPSWPGLEIVGEDPILKYLPSGAHRTYQPTFSGDANSRPTAVFVNMDGLCMEDV